MVVNLRRTAKTWLCGTQVYGENVAVRHKAQGLLSSAKTLLKPQDFPPLKHGHFRENDCVRSQEMSRRNSVKTVETKLSWNVSKCV